MNKKNLNFLSVGFLLVAVSILLYREKNSLLELKNYFYSSNIQKIHYERNSDEQPDLSMFSFAIIGSSKQFSESRGKYLLNSAKNIENTNVDLVFAVGDMISECRNEGKCANEFNLWKKAVEPLLPIMYQVQGNYDRSGGDRSDIIWRNEFDLPINGPDGYDELTYSFNFGNSHFVVLDTEKPKEHAVSEVQLDWLDYDLGSNNDKDNTFVFFHEPAFPVNSKVGDSLDANLKDKNRLWNILDSHDVTAVFNGHENIFSRRIIDNNIFPGANNSVWQFIIGNTDALLESNGSSDQAEFVYLERHYAIIDVEGRNITLNLYSPEGTLVHSFSFSKEKK